MAVLAGWRVPATRPSVATATATGIPRVGLLGHEEAHPMVSSS